MQGSWVPSLIREALTCCGANPCITSNEPVLGASASEDHTPGAHALRQSLRLVTGGWAPFTATRKRPAQQQRPSTGKKNKIK